MVQLVVQKNKAYFKRQQPKYRRRREGKTDYKARRYLVTQDKDKYNARKFRFIVRSTNTRIVCQVACATLRGDVCVARADSSELAAYGVVAGLRNYSAAYLTGLLCARRALAHFGLDKEFAAVTQLTGEPTHNEDGERRAFKCFLDIGIVTATTGNRAFGALKGATDGGLAIPHSEARFAGYDGEQLDAQKHKDRLLGKHVADYMTLLKSEEPEKYQKHFSAFIKAGITAEKVGPMYEGALAKIRANPAHVAKKPTGTPKHERKGDYIHTTKGKYLRFKKLTCEQRKARVLQKMDAIRQEAIKA